jgi:CheY-like chemotaxis protein
MSEMGRAPVILVVDDEKLILELVKDALEDAGFEVLGANTFADAMGALEGSTSVSLSGLVTDINLDANGGGWEVARRARELIPTLAIVYMSGDSVADWTAQGVPQSVMISKPFAPTQVVVAIASLANNTAST